MKNSETGKREQVGEEAIGLMLAEVRLEERRGRADVMAARLEKMSLHIIRHQLNGAEAADLLRQEVENLHNQARGTH